MTTLDFILTLVIGIIGFMLYENYRKSKDKTGAIVLPINDEAKKKLEEKIKLEAELEQKREQYKLKKDYYETLRKDPRFKDQFNPNKLTIVDNSNSTTNNPNDAS